MSELLFAGALFLATHLGISNSPLRPMLMRTLTERGYQGLYSLVALVTVVYLVMAYNDAPRLEYLWNLDPRLYWVPKLLMLPAFILFAGGLKGAAQTASPLPGCAMDEAALAKLTSGINRVTRHPVQWAFILWAASHIIANGDAVSVVFFAVFLLLSAVGSLFADRKKAAAYGEDWQAFAAATSHLPFAAVVAGRNKMAWGELGVPSALGLALYIGVFWGHEWLSGVGIYW